MVDETTAQTGTGNDAAVSDAAQVDQVADKGNASQTTGTLAGGADGGSVQETAAVQSQAAETAETSWRDKLAGEDATFRKQLERYTDEAAFGKAHRALLQKMSSGELKANVPFPDKGTPEEQAAWRKEHGVPEKPEEYKIELPNGVVPGEADKPLIESFTQSAHSKNWSPQQVNEALGWYYSQQDAMKAQREEADEQFRSSAEDELRNEWGPDFRRNQNIMGSVRDMMPEGLAAKLFSGRTAEGHLIGNDPAFLRWIVGLGRELNPAATVLPAVGADPMKSLSNRKAELEKMMGDRSSDYWRGPNAEKNQAEYRDILTAQERMKSRAA